MLVSNIAIRRPVTTILFTSAVILFGLTALRNMGVDLFPEVELPMITITAVLPGADPEIMDADVTEVIEEYVNTIEGVKSIQSRSTESVSRVTVEFDLGKNIDVAAQEVRDKINVAQARLPRDLEPPIVDKLDLAAQPILWAAVASDGDSRRLARYADEVLKERLQTVPGVGSVSMGGFREREIRVWLDPAALEAYQLTAMDVARAIQTKHIELPGGRVEQPDMEYVVKIQGEYESPEALEELVIKQHAGGVVRLRDVAEVVDGAEDLRSVARYNGLPAIGLGIRKQSGANTVAVAREVRAVIQEMAESAPEGISVQVAFDSSRFIESSMRSVLFDLFLGALLTGGVMLLFLRNFRMTLISVLAIPVSIIGSFIAMYAMGFTINNMTMLAMSLAIGIVIDDTIVVLENIFRHVETKGQGAMQAAREGAGEVGLAVLAASTSIMAVFLPVAFMQGIIGRFFFQFGLAVVMAVVVSVTAAFTVIPMLCSRLLKHQASHGRIFSGLERGFQFIERTYARTLDLALRRRWATLGVALLLFAIGLGLIPLVEMAFVTEPDESRFMIRYEFPTGTSIHRTADGLRDIERVLFQQDEVQGAFAAVGLGGGVNGGLLFVNLVPTGQRRASQAEVMARMRGLLNEAVPAARVSIETLGGPGGGGRSADVHYIVQGPTVQELDRVTAAITAEMRNVDGMVDIDTDLRLNKPELQVSINRDMADDVGIDVRTITETFNVLLGGMDVATYKEGGKRYDIRLRAAPDARLTTDDLYQFTFRSPGGQLVRAANLVTVSEGVGPNAIARYNRQRAAAIYANLEGMKLGEAMSITNEIVGRHVPNEPGWSVALGGVAEVFEESFRSLLYALLVAILVIYIILGSQFESFIHPFTILMSVPLAVIGGIGFLLLTGKTLDIFSFIGFVMLVGIVTKNAILLVDFTNRRRAQGMSRDEALREAGPIRLRPILMTALTTMAAVLPVALAFSEGGEQRAPMGVAVIGGMFTSTLLTLLVIPCVYTVMDDVSLFFTRRFGRLSAAHAHDGAATHPTSRPDTESTP